jgi:hypothetical protein
MTQLTAQSFLIAMLCFSPAIAGAGSAEFSCTGPFGRDSSHAALVKAFGAQNVSHEKVDMEQGGDTMPMTIVFPMDPKRRLMVQWHDDKGRRGLDRVVIRSPAWSVGGASVGMSLVEVERLNGKPFKIIDYDGDLGGGVMTWQGGKLETKLAGGCRLGASFALGAAESNLTQWKGDNGLVSSDDAAFRSAAKPRLYELIVYFPAASSGQ